MSKLLIVGTHGPEDPSRASLPFHIGKGALEAGCQLDIILGNDASLVMKESVRDSLFGVAMPPLKELFQFVVSAKARIYI